MSAAVESGFFLQAIASLDAEHSVIGALLLDNAAFDRVADSLKPEHFFNDENRLVYAEICRQLHAGKGCDVVTVGIALAGRVEMAALNRMAQFVPSSANVRRYAATVVERSKSRGLLQVSAEITELAQDHERSIADRVDAAQGQLMKLVDEAPRDDWVSLYDGLSQHMAVLEAREQGLNNAMPTGLRDLDEMLDGGLARGNLIIIGARPSMGKTALALSVAAMMSTEYTVGVLSMEMPHADLRDRAIAMVGRMGMGVVRRPAKYGGLDWNRVTRAVELAKGMNLHVSDASGLNINQIRSKARALKRLHGLDVLVLDYIGLSEGTDKRQQRVYQLEEISRGLKGLAKELDMAVLCLAQLNRKVEERVDQTPVLSDLRDSGAIEQDADVVAFIHRPIHSRPDLGPEWADYAVFTIPKNRQGRCGKGHLRYIGEQTRFDDWNGEAPTRATAFASRGREL